MSDSLEEKRRQIFEQLTQSFGIKHEDGFEDKIALCLSGGGFRAALFHLGAIWRLHDADLLKKVGHIAGVSGGSIPAALVAMNWVNIFTEENGFRKHVADRLMDFTRTAGIRVFARLFLPILAFHTVIISLVLFATWFTGYLLILASLPIIWAIAYVSGIEEFFYGAKFLNKWFEKELFGNTTFESLVGAQNDNPKRPELAILAGNLQTGNQWRFETQENGEGDLVATCGDDDVGHIPAKNVRISHAVAASCAFPILLSPFIFRPPNGQKYVGGHVLSLEASKPDILLRIWHSLLRARYSITLSKLGKFQPFQSRVSLTDGGAYDNLAFDHVDKRMHPPEGTKPSSAKYWHLLVSDASSPFTATPYAAEALFAQLQRVIAILSEGNPRQAKQRLIANFESNPVLGTYWSIGSHPSDFVKNLPAVAASQELCGMPQWYCDANKIDPSKRSPLAYAATGLWSLGETAYRIVDYGYMLTDLACRTHFALGEFEDIKCVVKPETMPSSKLGKNFYAGQNNRL